MHPTQRALLLQLAAGGRCSLHEEGRAALQALVEAGLARKVDTTRQQDQEARYESLQEMHRRFQEAKACLRRLDVRMAPRSLLGGLRSASRPAPLRPDDPDLLRLSALMQELDVRLPGAAASADILGNLGRIQDRIFVDNRACLDRMALLDREMGASQKRTPPGAEVEEEGRYALTPAGERTLPEAQALEALEAALHAVAGSKRHRIDDYSLFRDDPASLLGLLLEAQSLGGLPSHVVASYEVLADAFERLAVYNDISTTRVRNAFLMRLIRAHPGQPQAPFLWCNRERLQTLMSRMQERAPASVAASPWLILYATDLLVAGPGDVLSAGEPERRLMLYGAVQQRLNAQCQGVDVGDGQFLRLALAILHVVLPRNIANPMILDRMVARITETAFEAMQHAPTDLGGSGARLLFGFHLAHHAQFTRTDLAASAEAYLRTEAPFRGPQGRLAPIQVALHALVAQDRALRAGLVLTPEEYAGTYFRIRRRLQQNKDLARAFATERAVVDDEPFLAANLTAQAYLTRGMDPAAPGRPDVGLAGVYEPPDHASAPLLGLPFGTLMLT